MNQKKMVRIIAIIMAVLLLLSLVASVIPARAYADDAELSNNYEYQQLKEKAAQARERLNSASHNLQQLRDSQAAVIEEKLALEERNDIAAEQIALLEEQIALINAEIELYVQKIAQKEADVRAAQLREDEQLDKYRVRLRAMEESGGYNILSLILNSESFSALLAAVDDYGDIMDSDVELYDLLQEARADHQAIEREYIAYKEDCEEKKSVQEANKAAMEAEKAQLEADIAESEALIEEYNQKIKEAEEEQAALRAAENAAASAASNFLANYLAHKAAAEAAAQQAAQQVAQQGGEGGYVPPAPSGGMATGSGSWTWPFPASYRISSTMKPRWGGTHSGVDIDGFALEGSTIVACDAGTVIKAEWYGGYGNCVMIDHNNGYVTLYGHLSSISVSNGQSVSGGQAVGIVGSTGTATGTHLHLEFIVNGSRVNPLAYFSGYVLEDGAGDPS